VNYRHAYHAGNFADVHKHLVLIALLEHLRKKPAPFFVLDTHAGRGEYDLRSAEAARGNEWQQGIGRLLALPKPLAGTERYMSLANAHAHRYPGSPSIVAALLRDGDRAVFVERHPEEANTLKKVLGRRKHVSVLIQDGYSAVPAHTPPKENRGLILVDPPFESDSEFSDAARALQNGLRRWPNGTYCLWYPIKPGNAQRRLHASLVAAGIKKMLVLELNVRPPDSPLGLNGSGLLLVNPPWQLDQQMNKLLPKLLAALANESGSSTEIHWLANE
jgi:23S rRNA (adenine2030-N6)-methyltransferase